MPYQQFEPHLALRPYIDAYWTVTGNNPEPVSQRILPDGCVDIILNLGDDLRDKDGISMKSENVYLVGTMTQAIESRVQQNTHLLGIRFKPAGFSAFYQYASLHGFTDKTVAFETKLAPDLKQTLKHSVAYLNRFFLNRLAPPGHHLQQVVRAIECSKGLLRVPDLEDHHSLSTRQLERQFKQFIGISPKEFISLVRFRQVLHSIHNNSNNKSLLHIAFDHGYYDHAHLANTIKKYTGLTPSQL